MSTTPIKPTRKFPPPCWTRDEALVLIEAYRDRWYALHRAFLKNPDWDTVAEKVTTSCPDVTPPKTAAQCRHKMEKLRQRHRAEKLRAASFPAGRFFSSWFYYEAMEAIENGSVLETDNNNNSNNKNQENVNGIVNGGNGIVNGVPVSDHRSLNPGRGIRFKPSGVQNLVTLAASSGFDSRISGHFSNWYNNQEDDDKNDENVHGLLVDSIINKNRKNSDIPYGGICVKPQFLDQDHGPRKLSKVVHDHGHGQGHGHQVDENGEMWVKVARNVTFQGKAKRLDGSEFKADLKQGRKRGGGGVIHEVVASIKLLGDGFMKMEKMKIDMVREIERMRVEAEMRRNQLILDSQKQIVDVFVKGLVETRKQPKTETMVDSAI